MKIPFGDRRVKVHFQEAVYNAGESMFIAPNHDCIISFHAHCFPGNISFAPHNFVRIAAQKSQTSLVADKIYAEIVKLALRDSVEMTIADKAAIADALQNVETDLAVPCLPDIDSPPPNAKWTWAKP